MITTVGISPNGKTVVGFGNDEGHTVSVWTDALAWDGLRGPPVKRQLPHQPQARQP